MQNFKSDKKSKFINSETFSFIMILLLLFLIFFLALLSIGHAYYGFGGFGLYGGGIYGGLSPSAISIYSIQLDCNLTSPVTMTGTYQTQDLIKLEVDYGNFNLILTTPVI